MNLATTTITVTDFINLSQEVAQLNLGYLGISVAILGVLGGVFVYFNIKPLKDGLDKQEKALEDLKRQAQDLLTLSAEQGQKTLQEFEVKLHTAFKHQEENLRLETINRLQEVEKALSDKIETVSENKDIKLKEVIFSYIGNQLGGLDKETTGRINAVRDDQIKEVLQVKSHISRLDATTKELDEKVKELQVYKYGKEGKRGAILLSVELLESAVDEYLGLKREYGQHDRWKDGTFQWKTNQRLRGLLQEINGMKVEEEDVSRIRDQLKKLSDENAFAPLIEQIEEELKKR